MPDLHAGAAEVDKQIDAQVENASGRRCREPCARAARAGRPTPPSSAARTAERRAAGRRGAGGASSRCSWPVAHRLQRLLRLSAGHDRYLSFTHYDLLSPPRWVGLGNYEFLFQKDPHVWPAVRNTLWMICIAVPLQLLFAFGVAPCSRARGAGSGFFRTIFYLPALAPPVAATLGLRLPAQPGDRPGQHAARLSSASRARCGSSRPTWSKPSLTLLGMWGIGNTMIIFLAALLDVPTPPVRVGRARRRRAAWQRLRWVTLPSISPVILFAVVIGVIEALQYFTRPTSRRNSSAGGAGQARRRRQPPRLPRRARRSSTPSCSTSRASAASTWATRRRWRCSCSSSRLRSRSLLIRNTRALGPLPGAGR